MKQQRPIYRFANSHIRELKTPLKVTDRAKSLFLDGQGGNIAVVDIEASKKKKVGAQGYVGFLNLMTAEIELVPAWNEGDGKKPVDFEYGNKHYGVISKERLGSNSGDVHIQGLIQLGLADKGGIHREMSAFGIFKGKGISEIPEPFIFQFRSNSSSQNGFAFQYEEAFLLYNYEPTLSNISIIRRSLPSEIARKIRSALIEQLPLDDSNSQIRGIKNDYSSDKDSLETEYLKVTDKKLIARLKYNMLRAAANEHYDILERIYALHNQYPQVISDTKFADYQKFLIPAIKANQYETVKILLENGIDATMIDKMGNDGFFYAALSKDKKIFDLLIQAEIQKMHGKPTNKKITNKLLNIMSKAAKKGHHEVVEKIYAMRNQYSGITLDIKIAAYREALIPAIKANRYEIVKRLLDTGINVEAFDSHGTSVLYHAAHSNDKRIFDLLIQVSPQADYALLEAYSSGSRIAVERLSPFAIEKQIKENLLSEIVNKTMDKNQKNALINLSIELNNCKHDIKKIENLLPQIQKQISRNREYRFSKYLPFTFLNKQSKYYKKIAALRREYEHVIKVYPK